MLFLTRRQKKTPYLPWRWSKVGLTFTVLSVEPFLLIKLVENPFLLFLGVSFRAKWRTDLDGIISGPVHSNSQTLLMPSGGGEPPTLLLSFFSFFGWFGWVQGSWGSWVGLPLLLPRAVVPTDRR